MFTPTVTEIPRRLESTSADTFIERRRAPAFGPPSGHAPRALPSNVIELRPAGSLARRSALAAA